MTRDWRTGQSEHLFVWTDPEYGVNRRKDHPREHKAISSDFNVFGNILQALAYRKGQRL